MVCIGSAPVLHLVVSTGFFLQPAVTTKIFALNLTLISVFTGMRSNEFTSVTFGPTMNIFFDSQFVLAGFLPLVYWICSGSFFFFHLHDTAHVRDYVSGHPTNEDAH